MDKVKRTEIDIICRRVQGFNRLDPRTLELIMAGSLGNRKADPKKIEAVCSRAQSAIWYTKNNIRGDGDGDGSAFPQQTAWEEFAGALADFMGSNLAEQKAISKIVMGYAPKGK